MSFCDNLRKARQRVGLTQQQVADTLGVTKSTYCGYETGKRQPDIPKLRRLSLLLCTSVDELLGLMDSSSERVVSMHEFELVKQFRAMDIHGQRLLQLILNEETSRVREQTAALASARSSNESVPFCIALQSAAPDFSIYLGPDGFRVSQVRRDSLPDQALFGLPVCGNALEPRFHDNQVLIVSSVPTQPGEAGVFLRQGLGAVRILGSGELLSLHSGCAPIPLGPDIHPCGTITGALTLDDIL